MVFPQFDSVARAKVKFHGGLARNIAAALFGAGRLAKGGDVRANARRLVS